MAKNADHKQLQHACDLAPSHAARQDTPKKDK